MNLARSEIPPPGAGFETVIWIVPAEAMSAAEMAACNCVLLANVVWRLAPFHCTAELEMKLLPFTVSVNAADPAVVLFGDKELIEGVGFDWVGCGVIGLLLVELPPPPQEQTRAKMPIIRNAGIFMACSKVSFVASSFRPTLPRIPKTVACQSFLLFAVFVDVIGDFSYAPANRTGAFSEYHLAFTVREHEFSVF